MSEITEKGVIVNGYKATDKNMKCRDYQFELGKWHEHDGELEMCASGFHFCEYPSGPWCFYGEGRVFHVEAEFVMRGNGPGAELKHVAKRIRLVSEIEVDGDRNTGDGNTGDGNTGDGNTGHRNTGHRNTGDGNTGHRNTGDGNTGHRNTGHRNTGHRNTGDGNTGHRNTGHRNTGDGNTGDGNTGDGNTGHGNTGHRNTGDGNTGDRHSGCLNHGDAKFFIFNEPANRDDVDFYLVSRLSQLLMEDDEIDAEMFLSLPNATPEKIKALHDAHKNARKK